MQKNIISKQTCLILILFTISIILPMVWFPGNVIIGGGDIGIPLWRPEHAYTVQSYSWMDTNATGNSYPNVFTALPFYLIFSVLSNLGISADILQKVLFGTIIFGSSLSIFFLGKIYFKSKKIASLAAFFCIFNLTTLSVWQRGVHNGMLMLLLAPLSLLLLARGIINQKYISVLWINIASFLLSYVFGSVGYVFSLWLLWTLFVLIILFENWNDKPKRKFLLTYYLILVISWIGTNAWWIVHLLASSNYVIGQSTVEELKTKGSDVLVGLKPYHEAGYIFRGISRYIHYVVKDWGEVYASKVFIMLSWMPTLVVFSTALIRKNYKSFYWKFLVITYVVVLIISKGINPPLGILNKLPYDIFQFLAPLRNPYEKVGILLTIPIPLLFALGTSQIISFFYLKKAQFFGSLTIFIAGACLTVLVWPLWLGKLFVSDGRKYTVSIPAYYQEANNWLKDKVAEDDTRILHLPLSWGESIDYNWGYTGIEPSMYLFDGPSIGYQIGLPSVDSRIRDLIISIHNQDTVNIQKALVSLNVGWVVVHNETVWRPRILESTERINSWIAQHPELLEHRIDFGPLSVFRINDSYRLGHIYTTNRLINVIDIKPQSSLKIWNKINKVNDSFFIENQGENKGLLNKFITGSIILPVKSSLYNPFPVIDKEIAFNKLAKASILPDSLVYPLVIFRESLATFLGQDDPVISCFIQSSKRLKESVLLVRQNKFEEAKNGLVNYQNQLGKCSKINIDVVIAYLGGKQSDLILDQFIGQNTLLNEEFKNGQVIKESEDTKRQLIEYLSNLGLTSRFSPQKLNNIKRRIIYNYSVPGEDNYTIKLLKPDQLMVNNPPKIISIDERLVEFGPEEITLDGIKYPKYQFSKGFHEIQLETEPSPNLFDDQLRSKAINPDAGFRSEIDPVTQKNILSNNFSSGFNILVFDLTNLNIEQNYELNFDLLIKPGAQSFITITHDSDPIDPAGNYIPAIKGQILYASHLPDGWEHVKIGYTPVLNSNEAKFTIIVPPQTEIKIRNITLNNMVNSDLVLEKTNDISLPQAGTGDIFLKKKDPTVYEVTINNQKPPYILVFSETFHPAWKVFNPDNKIINLPHININGFANAWLVEGFLPEKIKIKFILQDSRNDGILISIISFLLMVAAVLYLDYKKIPNA